MQYNSQRALSVMADIESRFSEDIIDVYLLQEPYVAEGLVCGLGSGLDVYCAGDWPKAAIAVRKSVCDVVLKSELSSEYQCVINVTKDGFNLLLASLYCQYGGDMATDIMHLRRAVLGADRMPLLIGLDANATSLVWHSKNLRERDLRGGILASGSSEIDVTLANLSLEQSFLWEWSVRPDLGVSDHNPILIGLKTRDLDDNL